MIASFKSLTQGDIPKTIVFAQTKAVVCKLYKYLTAALGSTVVGMYHASLTPTYKQSLQRQFSSNESSLRCLVATVAFGMVSFFLINLLWAPRTLFSLFVFLVTGDGCFRRPVGSMEFQKPSPNSTKLVDSDNLYSKW